MIKTINKYISSINFLNLETYYKVKYNLINYIEKHNLEIDIKIDEKIIDIYVV